MRRIIVTLVTLAILAALCLPAAAKQTESADKNYNFAKAGTVLIMEPTFSYDGFDVSGDDEFVKYPVTATTITAMLNARKGKLPYLRYVTLDYVSARVRADHVIAGDCPDDPREFSALVQREMPKYADLVLYVDIRDYGWFYEYQAPYDALETVYERVRYCGRTSDGKEFTGWMEVPHTVAVHYPAHHHIFDSAEARFALLDTRSWKYVWQFTDVRTRVSNAIGKAYDPSGPESMMNRIFDAAFEKIPLNTEKR